MPVWHALWHTRLSIVVSSIFILSCGPVFIAKIKMGCERSLFKHWWYSVAINPSGVDLLKTMFLLV